MLLPGSSPHIVAAILNYHTKAGMWRLFIGGDYFFLETLQAMEGKAPDFWGTGEFL
jgi:hypothetical protein